MDTLLQDLRYGARALARSPGFTAVAALTLALGIGANTAIFSVVHAVLLRPLPYREPDRLVLAWETRGPRRGGVTAPDYVDWKAQNQVFETLAARDAITANLTGTQDPERVEGRRVTADYLPMLGVRPERGRLFTADEDRPGASHVVVLSHGLWERRFGADPALLGRSIRLDGEPYQVLGVMPAGVGLPGADEEFWVPLAITPEELRQTGNHRLVVVGRLRPGVSREQAEAEMKAIARRIEPVRPHSNTGISAVLVPLREGLVGDVRSPLLLLLGAVGFVVLIACGNVANLLLARAAGRQREIAVRASLGASRGRVVRQLLVESLLLALVGGVAGVVVGGWGIDALVRTLPAEVPRVSDVRLDATVLGFTLLLSLATGVLFGLVPALRASRLDLTASLKEGARTMGGVAHARLRAGLTVSQVALALLLLVGAGLLIKSFARVQEVKAGFDANQVLTFRLALPEARYREPVQVAGFYRDLLERAHAIPGVSAAGAVSHLPLDNPGASISFWVEGRPRPAPERTDTTRFRAASPGYFQAMSVPVVRGRGLDERDGEGTPRVGVINQTMARRHFAGQDPIGQRLTLDDDATEPLEIVGVVGDVRHFGLDAEPQPELYLSYAQATPLFWKWQDRSLNLVLRTAGDPADVAPAVRGLVRGADPDLPVIALRPMTQVMADSLATRRVYMRLLALFAALALALAAVGIYGVLSYAVARRTGEVGLRMALGATRADVLRLVVGEGLKLTGAGIILGLVAAVGLTRVLVALLFEVSPTDPLTFAAVACLLAAVAVLASYLPAHRATRVDPLVALRYE
jgi:putative ABC transport system permease protein